MRKQTVILGISAYYHSAAATLMIDGEVVAAAEEERFTRKKGDAAFPHHAINYCLNEAKISIGDVDYFAFYENHLLKFSRVLHSSVKNAPYGVWQYLVALPKQLATNIWLESVIRKELGVKNPIHFWEHHESHAASAFFPSPFKTAAILTIDGVGEYATTTYGVGQGNKIEVKKQIDFPDSVGLLYSAFTYYAGFKINSGEYKLMGLAPYGKPRFAQIIKKELVKIFPDGSLRLNMEYFSFERRLATINRRFCKLFGAPPRKPESEITQHTKDIAASIQEVVNEIMLKLANHIYAETGEDNLCLAGGVALNVSAIGYIREHSHFKNIWVQPASSDAGGSLGAAYLVWYRLLDNSRVVDKDDSMRAALLGPEVGAAASHLRDAGAKLRKLNEDELVKKIVDHLTHGEVVGLARGRMEFGPRALGSRSILADARVPDMKDKLNQKIKLREGFRPFAPIVLAEDAAEYFVDCHESPYMLATYQVAKKYRNKLPAITHEDGSARVQTVDRRRHPFLYKVLKEFKKRTGCSVLINTSYNVRGEPIVATAEQAFACFMETDMDACAIGEYWLEKPKQDMKKYFAKRGKKTEVELD